MSLFLEWTDYVVITTSRLSWIARISVLAGRLPSRLGTVVVSLLRQGRVYRRCNRVEHRERIS
jgi:hypothetical protein